MARESHRLCVDMVNELSACGSRGELYFLCVLSAGIPHKCISKVVNNFFPNQKFYVSKHFKMNLAHFIPA